jgi:phosphoribosyl 1,2-cyclic phosphate phosphodiesterase
MHLRIRLLGTGPSNGVPLIGGPDGAGDWGACDPANPRNRRTRTSALVTGPDGFRLLIDPGPDLRQQLLAARIGKLDAVFVTHAHADHIMGLDELRQVNRETGRELPLYAAPETVENLRDRFGYAFLGATPGFFRPALRAVAVEPGAIIPFGAMQALVLDQDHKVMRTLGLRIGNFAYCTDVVRMPVESLEALRGVDSWVVGCFGVRPHPVHAHVALAAEWAATIGARRTILTHMGNSLDEAALRASLTGGLEPGFDGLGIDVEG